MTKLLEMYRWIFFHGDCETRSFMDDSVIF